MALAFSCGIPSHAFSPSVSSVHISHCIQFQPRLLWAVTGDAENPGKVTPSKATKATKATKSKATKAAKPKKTLCEKTDAAKPTKETSIKAKKATTETSKKKAATNKTKASTKKNVAADAAAPPKVFLEDELTGRRGFSLTSAMLQSEGFKVNMPASAEATREEVSRPTQPLRGYSLAQMALRAEQSKAQLQPPTPVKPVKSPKEPALPPQHYSLTGSTLQGEGSKFGRRSARAQMNILQAQHSTGMDWLGQTTIFVPAYKKKDYQQQSVATESSTS